MAVAVREQTDVSVVAVSVRDDDSTSSTPVKVWSAQGSASFDSGTRFLVGQAPDGLQTTVVLDASFVQSLAHSRLWVSVENTGVRVYQWVNDGKELREDEWLNAAGQYQHEPCG